jgi:hypothetical protein
VANLVDRKPKERERSEPKNDKANHITGSVSCCKTCNGLGCCWLEEQLASRCGIR